MRENWPGTLGMTRIPQLLVSHDITTPFVMGVFRPVVLFPANYFLQLTPAQIESILIHELAHIRRNDFLLNIIQVVTECLFFFNPAVWLLSRRVRNYRGVLL